MIKDFSFGQYYPQNSIIHKLDPRLKLLLLVAYIVFVFLAFNYFSLAYITILIFAVVIISKVPIKVYLKNFKVILPVIILTSILNALYVTDGNLLFGYGIVQIYDQGLIKAVFMSLRIFILVLSSSVLSYTTTPTELTDAIESVLSPFMPLLDSVGVYIGLNCCLLQALGFPVIVEHNIHLGDDLIVSPDFIPFKL